MLAGLTGIHLLVLAAVILVIFGATKLPVFAKSLGQSVRIMRGELQTRDEPADQPDAVPVEVRAETVRPER